MAHWGFGAPEKSHRQRSACEIQIRWQNRRFPFSLVRLAFHLPLEVQISTVLMVATLLDRCRGHLCAPKTAVGLWRDHHTMTLSQGRLLHIVHQVQLLTVTHEEVMLSFNCHCVNGC